MLAVLKRGHKVLPISEKVNVLNLIRKKMLYAEVAKIYSKNESSVHEMLKNNKKHVPVLLSQVKLQKL